MKISHQISGLRCTLTLVGQLALESVDLFKQHRRQFLENPDIKEIVLDFSNVDFVDSKGVHLLVSDHLQCQNQERLYALSNVDEKIMNLFQLCGISDHIAIVES